MGFVLRVRLASFFTGAATASFLGLYILHRDYKLAQESFTQQSFHLYWNHTANVIRKMAEVPVGTLQMKSLHESLDRRIASLENLKQTEASQHVEATE